MSRAMSSDESDPPSPRNYKRSRPRSRSPSPRDNFANGDSPRVGGASPIGGSPVREEFDRASRSRSRDHDSPSRSQSKEQRSRSRSHSHSHKKHSKNKHRSTSHSPKRKKKHHHHHKRSHSHSHSPSPSRSHERYHRRSNSPHYRRKRYSPDRRGYGRPRYNSYGRGYRSGGPKQRPLNVPENKVIGVFGMSMYTSEKNIEDYFKRYGKIEKVHVILDRQTGNSRGFAFVYFEDINDAIDAKESCDGLELDGRKIRVDYSLTKEPHSPTPGIYMGRKNSRSDDYDYDRRR